MNTFLIITNSEREGKYILSRTSILDACLILKESQIPPPPVVQPQFTFGGQPPSVVDRFNKLNDQFSSAIHLEMGPLKIGQMTIDADKLYVDADNFHNCHNVIIKDNVTDDDHVAILCKYENLIFAESADELRDVIYELHRKASNKPISKRQFDALKDRLKVKEDK